MRRPRLTATIIRREPLMKPAREPVFVLPGAGPAAVKSDGAEVVGDALSPGVLVDSPVGRHRGQAPNLR
jgi:hypothetical protein